MSKVRKTVIQPQVEAAVHEIAALVATFPPEARAAAAGALIEALAENSKRALGVMFDVSYPRWAEITGTTT